MPTLKVALFNYAYGGRERSGQYKFEKLKQAFRQMGHAPDIIMINEALKWDSDGGVPLFFAVNALSQEVFGRAYEGRQGYVGTETTPTATPALLYDPQVIRLDVWGDHTVNPDQRNMAEVHLWSDSRKKFRVRIEHLNANHGDTRLRQAHDIKRFSEGPPTLLGGDLNSTASGPHIPKMNWYEANDNLRRSKALRLPDGSYVDDTRPLDLLIGPWDETQRRRITRELGWFALAELAYYTGTPAKEAFRPTVNDRVDRGGSQIIDWLLVNPAWAGGYVPGSYRVHVPPGSRPEDYPSDHRLVEADLEL